MCYTGRGDKEKSHAQMCGIIGRIYTVFDFSVTSKKNKKTKWMNEIASIWSTLQQILAVVSVSKRQIQCIFLFTGNCKTLLMLWRVLFLMITLIENMRRKLKKFTSFSQFGHPSHIPGLIVWVRICGRVQRRASSPKAQICSTDLGTNAAWIRERCQSECSLSV